MLDPCPLPSAEQLLAAIRTRNKSEHRRQCRHPLVCHAAIFVIIGGVPRWSDAVTCDLSSAGLGFYSAEPLGLGDIFIVYLKAGSIQRLVLARCAHARMAAKSRHTCGSEFLEIITIDSGAPVIPESWLRRLQAQVGHPLPAAPPAARPRPVRTPAPVVPAIGITASAIPGDFI